MNKRELNKEIEKQLGRTVEDEEGYPWGRFVTSNESPQLALAECLLKVLESDNVKNN